MMRRNVHSVRTKSAAVMISICFFLLFGALMANAGGATEAAPEVDKIIIALGDIETVETLHFLIALEKVKEKGLDVELVSFKSEDIGSQAVINKQAQIGVGTPYSVIQNVSAPIRIFYQLSTLQFFPVVNKEFYSSWQDLDGEEMVVHSRTSGTLALANLMALKENIKYGQISYVPGSEVRALAMLKGNIKATYLDSFNKEFLMKEAPGKFLALPAGDATASDECLFATMEFIESNPKAMDVLLEELLKVWRKVNADPANVVQEREKYGLLSDLPKELEPEVLPFFEMGAKNGMFPNDGGGEAAARQDIEFYAVAGQLKGDPKELKVEDFWTFEPLKRALKKVK